MNRQKQLRELFCFPEDIRDKRVSTQSMTSTLTLCPHSQSLPQNRVHIVNDYADIMSAQSTITQTRVSVVIDYMDTQIFKNIKLHFLLLLYFSQSKIISHVSALTTRTLVGVVNNYAYTMSAQSLTTWTSNFCKYQITFFVTFFTFFKVK